jgi:hypothetical protein
MKIPKTVTSAKEAANINNAKGSTGRFFSGGVRMPRATNRCSCSEQACRRQGTIRATGWLRSHTSTSSSR